MSISSSNDDFAFKAIEKEAKALALMNEGRYAEAIPLWEEILSFDPEWEHGSAYDCIALCYLEIGDIEKAREAQWRAVEVEPTNEVNCGNWTSFLIQHGEPGEALVFGTPYLEEARLMNRPLLGALSSLAATFHDPQWKQRLDVVRERWL